MSDPVLDSRLAMKKRKTTWIALVIVSVLLLAGRDWRTRGAGFARREIVAKIKSLESKTPVSMSVQLQHF